MVNQTIPFGERRLFERKSCSRMIAIKDDQELYSGHMRDLAIGGALIEPAYGNNTRIGQELMLTIPFALKKDHIIIKARVAWATPGGIGVKFIKSPSDIRSWR